ncbi:T9SS type A sorting domain-containing protein [Chryseobacterium sp.]|uniref:T9SS type A sorting domain-containing protein n=1 Tax=Chryseobacterium sp. TaxID=1871047 RepID=UPI00289CD74F|nr:T9SS type A sorting domain-containing protein [Chryseobacterium sp.]
MKRTTIFLTFSLFISFLTFAQTSTATFETESAGSTSFTNNGVVFNIISNAGTFDVYSSGSQWGWNGTSADYRFIDNTGSTATTNTPSFSIKTTSNLFKVQRFWLFCGDQYTNPNATGTITVTGKLSGVTKFSNTKTSGFVTSTGESNGYTLFDLTNFIGMNYSNIIIDEITITAGGNFRYLGLDALTWVKDSNIVLATSEEAQVKKNQSTVYPNPTSGIINIVSEKNEKFNVYSPSGKTVKTIETQKGKNRTDISELPSGVYIFKSENASHKVIKK